MALKERKIKTVEDALERIKTLPWAYHSREEGEKMIKAWKTGESDRQVLVLEELQSDINCHEICGNYTKANYIRDVYVVLRNAVRAAT